MKKWLIGLVILVLCGVYPYAYAAQTDTATSGYTNADTWTIYGTHNGFSRYTQHIFTASAAGEQACMDVRGYSICTAKATVTGTINVDLDWNLTGTYDTNYVVDEDLDITANQLTNIPVTGQYLCYDVDACTTCTLSLTVYCTTSPGVAY